MVSRLCMVALTLGGSIISSQAGQLTLSTADGSRIQLNCVSDEANQRVLALQRPLEGVMDTLHDTLTRSGEDFVLREQAFRPKEVANSLRVVYEALRPAASGQTTLQVRAYIDLNLQISEARRARLLDEAAERAGVSPNELERDVTLPAGVCQVRR